MSDFKINKIAKIAIVAAVYAVLTASIAPISYGAIQFRLSEVMTLLAFIDPIYIPGLVLGCAISNLFSPLGIVDVIVGTTATFISVYMISKCKNLFVASLWPTINCVFIGAELYYLQHLPFWLTSLQVAIGEFVVVTLIGYPVFKILLKNNSVMRVLKVNS
ncbi:QueT transporter family protein [Clostridium botulinum C]|uniref:QueT transporter family protein n=4 Tax=Clostridium TaxID=1485 RepID=A0A9Q4THR9_CLOBO|nr:MULTISPECIES: QueT transporter family protein [Clostridium]EGO88481.1 membrane protein [Clostridium botulinum C str. Stockholm]EES92116.1 putative membrane protein [Clostridium botulinum D str. 1873]KEI08652.1 membrane protein [Clostridium sp. K25]KEI14240.1 membrane protein [Clostridium novyi B str. ATCC 27606]KEI14602.1 membrane protein [Clostridium novyi B str. NCTC 9691]